MTADEALVDLARHGRRLHACCAALAALSACAFLALLAPTSAFAAEKYRVASHPCTVDAGGQFDNQGTFYLACGTKVMRWNAAGTRLSDIALWGTSRDVAPGPDGKWIFVHIGSVPYRVNYDAKAKKWVRDTNWKAEPFPAQPSACNVTGKYPPKGRSIESDAFGYLYVSNGGWVDCTPNVITRHAPDGKLLNQFGDYGDGAGQFRVNMGLDVSMDGRTIYTVEQTNSRVQRFDWSPRGQYEFTMLWGEVDDVNCANGKFAAPYDVGLDPWGYVYVQDTSCRRIQKFTEYGTHLISVQVEPLSGKKAHAIGVDAQGNAVAAQVGKQILRESPTPGPWPDWQPLPPADTKAPEFETLIVPETTDSQQVGVQLVANDNSRVFEMRFADETGEWGPWLPFEDATTVKLTDGYGYKAITAQVRDEAWNESTMLTRTVHFQKPQDLEAPELDSVTAPQSVAVGASVILQLQASDDVGVSEVRTADESGWWKPWQAYAPELSITPSDGHGAKGVYVQVRDAAGNESEVIYRTYSVVVAGDGGGDGQGGDDEDLPPDEPEPQPGDGDDNGNIVPGQGPDVAAPLVVEASVPPTTTTQTVVLTLNATDDTGVVGMRTANEDGNWRAWSAFQAESQHELSAGPGYKAVFVQVRDAAGNESAVQLLRTQLLAEDQAAPPGAPADPDDQTPPDLDDLVVPAATGTQDVAVGLVTGSADAVHMRLANEDGNWGPWTAYAAEHEHRLTAGYGVKGVFAQLRDGAGNESDILFRTLLFAEGAQEDAVAEDEADPVVHGIALPDPATTQDIRVVVDATDDTRVTGVRLANEDGEWLDWQPWQPELIHMLSDGLGHKAIYAQVRDAAGRESNIVLARLTRTA